MQGRLSSFQREVLEAFAELEPELYLTGGAALAGFHLGHRTTQDLALFVTESRLEDGAAALREVAMRLGAELESLRTSPSFRRFLVRRREEGVVVDLVHDPTPQGGPKQRIGKSRSTRPRRSSRTSSAACSREPRSATSST